MAGETKDSRAGGFSPEIQAKLERARKRGGSFDASAAQDPKDPSARKAFVKEARVASPLIVAQLAKRVQLFVDVDDPASRQTFVKRRWNGEPTLRQCRDELVRRAGGSGGLGTFIDLYAHGGAASVIALARLEFPRAIAFEPRPDRFRTLKMNRALNGLDDELVCVQAGVSTSARSVNYGSDADGWAVREVAVDEVDQSEVTPVRFDTVETLIRDGGIDSEATNVAWVEVMTVEDAHALAAVAAALRFGVPVVVSVAGPVLQTESAHTELGAILTDLAADALDAKQPAKPFELPGRSDAAGARLLLLPRT